MEGSALELIFECRQQQPSSTKEIENSQARISLYESYNEKKFIIFQAEWKSGMATAFRISFQSS